MRCIFSNDRCGEGCDEVECGWGSSECEEHMACIHPRAAPAEPHSLVAAPGTV